MQIRSWLPPWMKPSSNGAGSDAGVAEDAVEVEVVRAPTKAPPQPPEDSGSSDPGLIAATPPAPAEPSPSDAEIRARREEIVRMEERALRQLESVETQLREMDRRRDALDDRERKLDQSLDELKLSRSQHLRGLGRVAGLSAPQARQILLNEVEKEARHQAGLTLQRMEEETKLEAERRARGILAVAMQRLAGNAAGQTTTRLVQLPNDEMKGRIIGREGRNIRTLENLTGVDFIIDETPSAVVLSSFDGVRREIARLTLERLIADGRIHPASCEEAYEHSKAEIDDRIVEEAEKALLDARVTGVPPELVRLLGRLKFRTS